jgi:5-hydroxyisourate hydrolase-like protein (transthyretin family)
VSGTVLVKGKPAAGVKVTFHPQFDMGSVKFTPNGETGKDGRFTLNTAAPGDGAPPGDYAVTFELMQAATDKRGLDTEVDVWKGKYADPAKSSWKVTIKGGDNVLEPFKLD